MQAPSIHADPYRVAPGTWVVPQLLELEPGMFAAVNSLVITAADDDH